MQDSGHSTQLMALSKPKGFRRNDENGPAILKAWIPIESLSVLCVRVFNGDGLRRFPIGGLFATVLLLK
jgi:hypothetical protein